MKTIKMPLKKHQKNKTKINYSSITNLAVLYLIKCLFYISNALSMKWKVGII